MRVFLLRYDFPLFLILFSAAVVSGVFFKNFLFFFLFLALAVSVMVAVMGLGEKYGWVCRECGYESSRVRVGKYKYCTECGGLMELRKIIHLYKICENGYRIRDKHNQYKFCPKCGKPLKEQIIPEMEEELNEEK